MIKNRNDILYLDETDYNHDSLETLNHKYFIASEGFHPNRKKEYLISRALIHKGFQQLNIDHSFLEKGEKREPIWPNDICGSISHSKEQVSVILSKNYKSIGIDIEHLNRVDEKLYHKLFSDIEVKFIKSVNWDAATTLFSAKEAFYKMQFYLTHQYLDFLDVEFSLKNDKYFNVKYLNKEVKQLDNIPPIEFELNDNMVKCLSVSE